MRRSCTAWLVLPLLLSGPAAGIAGEPAATPVHTPRETGGRPNIILLIGDDHGYPYFGFTGSDIVQTPNLDALARHGTTFTRAHTTASTCPPSLNTLLTGLYPTQWQTRVRQLRLTGHPRLRRHQAIEYVATLPKVLEERGYVSFQAGKFWEGPATLAGFTAGTVVEPEQAYKGGDHNFGRQSIDPALRFIDENAERPFFLWFAPMLPHTPLDAPERYHAPYVDAEISRAEKLYYANCTWFDDLVGKLVRHLDHRGLRKNTLLVYISDNGFDPTATRHRNKGKHSMHEQGFRTPLVFNWPDHVPEGRVVDQFISSTDVFPTLCGFAGVEEIPTGRHGTDLRPLLNGGRVAERAHLIGKMHRKVAPETLSYYVTNADWHYIWNVQTGEEQLFDKKKDPQEDRNVFANHPEVAAKLRAQIAPWERAANAPFDVSRQDKPPPN